MKLLHTSSKSIYQNIFTYALTIYCTHAYIYIVCLDALARTAPHTRNFILNIMYFHFIVNYTVSHTSLRVTSQLKLSNGSVTQIFSSSKYEQCPEKKPERANLRFKIWSLFSNAQNHIKNFHKQLLIETCYTYLLVLK